MEAFLNETEEEMREEVPAGPSQQDSKHSPPNAKRRSGSSETAAKGSSTPDGNTATMTRDQAATRQSSPRVSRDETPPPPREESSPVSRIGHQTGRSPSFGGDLETGKGEGGVLEKLSA